MPDHVLIWAWDGHADFFLTKDVVGYEISFMTWELVLVSCLSCLEKCVCPTNVDNLYCHNGLDVAVVVEGCKLWPGYALRTENSAFMCLFLDLGQYVVAFSIEMLVIINDPPSCLFEVSTRHRRLTSLWPVCLGGCSVCMPTSREKGISVTGRE